MRLDTLFQQNKLTLSFEVFPPKTDTALEKVKHATEAVARLHPSFMSVTYGAGGSAIGQQSTCNLVRYIQEKGIDVTSQVVKNDSVYLEIASKIISEACNAFDNFDRSILITLADHIAFAVKRMESGLVINNPFKNDIRIMFKEEYDIAKRSADIISDEINIDINEDETNVILLWKFSFT